LKFGYLLEKALSFDAEYLSTGHYARIKFNNSVYHLLKGRDSNKDQSYVLYTLTQEQCKHILFPLGEYSKDEVRVMALENNLPTAEEPSSQDICFISGNYSDFLGSHVALAAGEIVDRNGKVLGQHGGIAKFTVGQRHGLGLSTGERLYVTKIETARNRVIVGTEEELYFSELSARNMSWISGIPPNGSTEVMAKIRYKSPEVAAMLYPGINLARVKFNQPQRAITPGQAIVFYNNNEVVGGGTIENQA
jgi:tRNA-specific 2-thiouridylase